MGFKVMSDGWYFTPQQVQVLCQLAINRNDYNNSCWEIKILLLKLNPNLTVFRLTGVSFSFHLCLIKFISALLT